MAPATLAQFIALHDELVALVKAGVSVHLGLPQSGGGAAAACERIGAAVVRRIGEGASVDEALADREVPAAYRSVVQLALASGDLPAALSGASRLAEVHDESWQAVRTSLRYPLVICGLAYVGIVLFCVFLVPILESMYASMQIPAGWGLAAVTTLRSTLPYWIAIPPLAMALFAALQRWYSARSTATGGMRVLELLPGMSKVVTELKSMRFAETLASYLDAGASFPQALRTAADIWESDWRQRQTVELAATLEQGQAARDDGPFAAQLPPLLRWAIWHADDRVGRSRSLRIAAGIYRDSAQRRARRLRALAPIFTCVVLGGGVVLLYALALFVPVAQMLHGLAG